MTDPSEIPEPSSRPEPHLPPGPPGAPGPSPTGQPPLPKYKGGDLDPERGPGLGCFYVQLVALVALLVVTPLSVQWDWSPLVSALLLFAIIVLLLLSGQTVIFLLRLVAAERGRRRPLAGRSETVGELEDGAAPDAARPRSSEDGGSVRE